MSLLACSWLSLSARLDREEPPSLLGVTVRRAFVLGKFYLAGSVLYAVGLSVATSLSGPTAFAVADSLFLPFFAAVGSVGGLVVFTGDRVKGVLEYLLAYGIRPRKLFENVVLASLLLSSLVIAVALAVGLGLFAARGHSLSSTDLAFLGLYAVPMSFASGAFTSMVGMYWTSLSSPRRGLSSPVGVMPFVGMIPSVLTLVGVVVVTLLYGEGLILVVTSGGVILLAAIVLYLFRSVDRRMPLEHLLSPT